MTSDIETILIELTGGVDPICSIKETAFIMGKSEQSVYAYRSGSSEPSFRDVARLNEYLIREKGYYRIATSMMTPCNGVKTNGEITDQLINLYEFGTDAHRAYKSKDQVAFSNSIQKMKVEIDTLKAEGDLKWTH